MTMAKVENGLVAEVGLPASLRGIRMRDLKAMGRNKAVDNVRGKLSTATNSDLKARSRNKLVANYEEEPNAATKPEAQAQGWYKVVDNEGKPTTETEPGYHWIYGAPWSIEGGNIVGTWQQAQRPQPYPSWSWVDGEGWVPPIKKPAEDYTWDENAQQWVEEIL